MIVSVNGARNRELTKLLKLAAQSFADKLLSPQLEKNIQLKIKIIWKLAVSAILKKRGCQILEVLK
jgi:hypothetical protein